METISQLINLKTIMAAATGAGAAGIVMGIAISMWRRGLNLLLRWAKGKNAKLASSILVFIGETCEAILSVVKSAANDWQVDEEEGKDVEKQFADAKAAGKALRAGRG